ncbi:VacJ family lipoprotein [Methylophilaceae bacterium]|nr:VacJ family lipoprotein [Methylophilaceae bacterium]MDC1172980.1 VacJ family lipoprotein [Methylophilaceae bacterium]
MKKLIKYILILAFLTPAIAFTTEDNDPLEGLNRAVYDFNEAVDGAVIKPVAKGYKAVMPNFAVKGVNNFYNNIRDVITVINDVLQLKIDHAVHDSGRVLLNSTVGILGFIDVHTINGGERRKEDFGQTLGHYGIGHGAYLVLPFLGPSSLRDGAGLATDTILFDPISYVDDVRTRNQIRIVQIIDKRAELINASDILGSASLDPYAFQRDAYLQYREALVNDKSTSEIDYEDTADSGFEPYIDEQVSIETSDKDYNEKVSFVD